MASAGRSDGALSPHSGRSHESADRWFLPVFAEEFTSNRETLTPHVMLDSSTHIKNARNIMSLENHKIGMPGMSLALCRSLAMDYVLGVLGLSGDLISFQGAEREG